MSETKTCEHCGTALGRWLASLAVHEAADTGSPHTPERCRTLLAAQLTAARAQVEEAKVGLKDALDGMEDMVTYVSPYFAHKHGHGDYINRARATLAKLETP